MSQLLENYKKFIDELVERVKSCNSLDFLTNRTDESGQMVNELVSKLNEDEIAKLNQLLKEFFASGIYHVLDKVNQGIEDGSIKIRLFGEKLPKEVLGNGLEVDFCERLEGEDWLDEQSCPLHQEKLKIGQARIVYGLVRENDFFKAEKKLFPFAKTVTLGGCLVSHETSETVGYCQACRRALNKWRRETGSEFGL